MKKNQVISLNIFYLFFLFLFLLFILNLSSCTKNNKDIYENWPAEKIYTAGHQYLKKGGYNDAIKAYESLNAQYPFSPPSKNGDLELIYAYYLSGDSAMSLAAASRYIKLYPNDPNAAYAYYMAGIVEFNNGRSLLEKYLPYQMSAHQSDNYLAAFNSFKQVLILFPNSPYTQNARRRMVYLNNTLAAHNLEIANYYFNQKAYVASAARSLEVIQQYPNTPAALQAMALLEKNYTALHLTSLVDQATLYYQTNLNNLNNLNIKK